MIRNSASAIELYYPAALKPAFSMADCEALTSTTFAATERHRKPASPPAIAARKIDIGFIDRTN
jgi:hypothetical protein